MPPKRMTANPIAPLRYRPGKVVGNEQPSSSESESESESENAVPARKTAPPPKATSFPKLGSTFDVNARQAAAAAAKAKDAAARKKEEEGFVTASESEESEAEGVSSDEEGDEESESEESSEEETKAPRFVAPTFVSKAKRQANAVASQPVESKEEIEERRRQEKVDEMVQVQLERDAAERAAGKRAWDDDDEGIADDVDDTDDVDPEAERAAWKLRELRRIKRDREAIEVAEKEREEVERRRNLTAEEREAEDKEFIAQQQQDREGKGQMGFMQKYFHKGAFFQGEGGEAEEAAKRRDIMGARFVDDAANRELLPQYMQIRDMTKLGKKGRTKYKDLKSEDTGRWGDFGDSRSGGGVGGRYEKNREGPSGANAYAVGDRRPRDDDRGNDRDEKRPRYDR